MAAALYRLNEALLDYGLSLEGINFATDNGYLSPVAVKACNLVMTTKLRSNQQVTLLSGDEMTITQIREQMKTRPIRHDPRAGTQA